MAELKENNSNRNIENINSVYIINVIFKFLDEKLKLNMIKYNKKLQKNVLVDIEYYKKISRKYIIFEGAYINGNRKRKGKEYDKKGYFLFEGEYLNGERNGKGKEYYDDGKLKFEGDYLYGKMWNGKGYNKNGNKEFEIKNGKVI